jgi:hypothetical protein
MTIETILIGLITHEFHCKLVISRNTMASAYISQANEALRGIFSGCAPTNIPLWCYWYWVPGVAFESILLFLALYKTIMEAQKSSVYTSDLMGVLLRDSVLYFGGVTLFTVVRLTS